MAECLERGAFEEAANALAGWRGVGLRPVRRNQNDAEYAEALQWAAVISVGLALEKQIPIGDAARDMLTESNRLSGSPVPLVWLGVCYYRCGEYGEASAVLTASMDDALDSKTRLLLLVTLADVVTCQGNYNEALDLMLQAEPLLAQAPMLSQGKFNLQRGLVFRKLNRLDDAIAAYENADRCFEDANSRIYEAAVCVNMAHVFLQQEKYLQAHVRAQRAVSLTKAAGHRLYCAKAWDTIATIHLAEGNLESAERAARQAISLVEDGEQGHVLAECLITHGRILGKMGIDQSVAALTRAANICAMIGDHAQAEIANAELAVLVKRCRGLISTMSETLRPLERRMIKDALAQNNGVIARAAKQLDMHINTLNRKIKDQFPELLPDRRPIFKRRKGIIGVNSHNPTKSH